MFRSLLIANRGEIACRVIRTARRLGIRTIAVYSDADRSALHVKLADAAIDIGPAPAADSYLNIAAILAAAKQGGAQAIHPGYGFLSENEEFAAACERAGFVFVGPSAGAIAAMGDKSAAKALMEKAQVPLVPGYHGANQDPAFLLQRALEIGFPVLLKPSAGGGGKGMRVVRSEQEFPGALEAACREAQAAFGDARVLLEQFLERSRHIEVQVFGDRHGQVVHLFERDCSVQRRYQKVLEEAPAPGLGAGQRAAMASAAVNAARAIHYTGAGTVEFIAETSAARTGERTGRVYFMELNTRLQVEHPVTEMITGLDLVEWQLRVASGERLPLSQEQIHASGHAIEARLYAERPEREFMPSTGRLVALNFPAADANLRVDSGVETGSEISTWYDPMIAKLIAYGATREEALSRLQHALREVQIAGVYSNTAFLTRIAGCDSFRDGALDTALIERERAHLFAADSGISLRVLASAAWAQMRHEGAAAQRTAGSDSHSPWNELDGWRLNEDAHHEFAFFEEDAQHVVTLQFSAGQCFLLSEAGRQELEGELLEDNTLLMRLGGQTFKARALRDGRTWHLFAAGEYRRLVVEDGLDAPDAVASGSLAAPLPGKLVAVLVAVGDEIKTGAPLLVIEAMKMEHTLLAPRGGRVAEIFFQQGDSVAEGAQLVRLEDE